MSAGARRPVQPRHSTQQRPHVQHKGVALDHGPSPLRVRQDARGQHLAHQQDQTPAANSKSGRNWRTVPCTFAQATCVNCTADACVLLSMPVLFLSDISTHHDSSASHYRNTATTVKLVRNDKLLSHKSENAKGPPGWRPSACYPVSCAAVAAWSDFLLLKSDSRKAWRHDLGLDQCEPSSQSKCPTLSNESHTIVNPWVKYRVF